MNQPVGTHPSRRERLLEAAQELMVAKGFAATSVDQVCEAAGVTKGAFFHYFRSKDGLAQALVERFGGALYESFSTAPFRSERSVLKRFRGYIAWTKKVAREPILAKGCLLGMFTQELAEVSPEIAGACGGVFDLWAGDLQPILDEMGIRGSAKMARHFVAVVEGALILAKAHRDPGLVDESLDQFEHHVLAERGRNAARNQ